MECRRRQDICDKLAEQAAGESAKDGAGAAGSNQGGKSAGDGGDVRVENSRNGLWKKVEGDEL